MLSVALGVAGCPPLDSFAFATTPQPPASAAPTEAGPVAQAAPSRRPRRSSPRAQPQHAAQTPQSPPRRVFLNNQPLNAEQLQQLDALNCGAPIPDGSYWLDMQQRRWGYTTDRESRELPDCSGSSEQTETTAAPAAPVAAPAADDDAEFQQCAAQYRYSEDINCYCRNICVTWPSATDPGSATIIY